MKYERRDSSEKFIRARIQQALDRSFVCIGICIARFGNGLHCFLRSLSEDATIYCWLRVILMRYCFIDVGNLSARAYCSMLNKQEKKQININKENKHVIYSICYGRAFRFFDLCVNYGDRYFCDCYIYNPFDTDSSLPHRVSNLSYRSRGKKEEGA